MSSATQAELIEVGKVPDKAIRRGKWAIEGYREFIRHFSYVRMRRRHRSCRLYGVDARGRTCGVRVFGVLTLQFHSQQRAAAQAQS